jgi:uncharacterized membrane protein YfcA
MSTLAYSVANLTLLGGIGLILALMAAGAAKGVIGVGMPIVAIPLVSHFVELPAAVALLSIPLILSNLRQAVEGGGTVAALEKLAPVLTGFSVGLVIGVSLLLTLDGPWLRAVIGLALLAAVVPMIAKSERTLSPASERIAGPIAGLLGGLFGGVAALPGPMVFVYLLATAQGRNRFVKLASVYLVVSSAALVLALGHFGHFTLADAVVSLVSVIPVLIGMSLGAQIRPHVPTKLFRWMVLAVVVASAIDLLFTGVVAAAAGA